MQVDRKQQLAEWWQRSSEKLQQLSQASYQALKPLLALLNLVHVNKEMTRRIDGWLLFSALFLLFLGWLMVTSASMEIAGSRYGNPFFFSIRHGIYLLMGL
ncbi:hypothetical protein ABMA58_09400, partial [Oceanospirillum sp. HFRX-1_2]